MLARDLDIPLIGRFALGGYWSSASPTQRAAYMDAFSAFIVSSYSRRLGGVRVTAIEIRDSRPAGRRDMVVRTRVKQSVGDAVRADWRLRLKSGRYRIVDLAVDGISQTLTLRQEFAAVLKAKGGVDGLVESLKARTLGSL